MSVANDHNYGYVDRFLIENRVSPGVYPLQTKSRRWKVNKYTLKHVAQAICCSQTSPQRLT